MKNKTKLELAAGAGFAAAAAAAAGAYFLTGKRGAKTRRKLSAWANKAKSEAVREFNKMKVKNAAAYRKMVSGVEKKYRAMKNIDPQEVAALVSELKEHWDVVSMEVAKAAKKVARKLPVKKAAKKAAKKRA